MNDSLDRPNGADALVIPDARVASGRPRVARDRTVEGIVREAFERHQRDLHSFARALVRDPDAAEDVVGDAFLRLVAEVRAGRTPDDPRAWLYRVVGNLVVSRGRRLVTARRFLTRLVDRRVAESPETAFVRGEVSGELLDALASLPTDMRVAIVMAARGVAGPDIADAIGRSDAATRTLLTRARHRLRDRLEPGTTEEGDDR